MILTSKKSEFVPHPEGIHPAVCVDVIDLGERTVEFQGRARQVQKLKLVFESEALTEDGKRMTVSRTFNASLHPKAKLAEFLGKWRGRPVVPGDSIDMDKLLGTPCTLVVSHQQGADGDTYANIDAISKATKKVTPSGNYDPKAARDRLQERQAMTGAGRAASAAAEPEEISDVGF